MEWESRERERESCSRGRTCSTTPRHRVSLHPWSLGPARLDLTRLGSTWLDSLSLFLNRGSYRTIHSRHEEAGQWMDDHHPGILAFMMRQSSRVDTSHGSVLPRAVVAHPLPAHIRFGSSTFCFRPYTPYFTIRICLLLLLEYWSFRCFRNFLVVNWME